MTVVLVIVALVRIMHMPRLISMMLMRVALVCIMLMFVCVVLVIVALVRIVHVPRFISMVLVTVTLVWIVDAHPVLLPARGSFLRSAQNIVKSMARQGSAPTPIHYTLAKPTANHPYF